MAVLGEKDLMTDWTALQRERLRVVLLLAGRGAGLDVLLKKSRQGEKSYRIVGALTTTPDSQAIPILEAWSIPWRCHDIREFSRRKEAKVRDLSLRHEFDQRSLDLIAEFEPSVLGLFGYIYILTRVMLDAFPWRVLNVHDSDLTVVDGGGRPKYPGIHATRDAILAGEAFTRSTVHFATDEVDAGPMLLLSRLYPIQAELLEWARGPGELDVLKAYAYAHREWMIRESWGCLLDMALELLGQGKVSVRHGTAFIDGEAGPWEADSIGSNVAKYK